MITEVLGGLGSWELAVAEQTPDEIVSQLGYFGHVVIVDGRVDVAATGDALLGAARYVGVCREKDDPGTHTRSGSGLLFWLGDEDGKGHVIETEIVLSNVTLAAAVTALAPPTVTIGTIFAQADPAQRYTGSHVFQSRRDALAIVCDAFGAEFRVNPNFTLDVGTPAQLYNTAAPDRIIKRRETGADLDLTAVGGDFDPSGSAVDYSTRIVLMGQTIGLGDTPDQVFATGSANAPTVPYKDPQGNQVKFTRLISESGETSGSVAARSQLQLNRFNRTQTALQVTTEDYEIHGRMTVGDGVYVYDPDTGMVDPATQVFFRGQVLHPQIVRVSARTWPVIDGMTVAWRTDAGAWIDLTQWVIWESPGSHELTVGDLPKTLIRTGGNAVQDRIDASRDPAGSTKQPKAPTGLTLTTASLANPKGTDSAVINATWNPVTQYTDNSVIALSHYEVSFRPVLRAPLWIASQITADVTVDLSVVAALGYDVRVRAVSASGVVSDWSASASITSAADTTAPPPPADPVTSVYLGQGRIEYQGTDNTGQPMPADTNRIDVHVGTTSGFTPTAATRVDSINPFAKGVTYATAPYGSPRWAKLIAVDHSGNPSAPSGAVAFTTTQVVGTDLAGNIIDLSKITFKDQGNLVEDGSFAITTLTATRAAASGWASVAGFDGSPAMQWAAGDGNLMLTTGVPVTPGEQIMARYMFTSSTGGGAGVVWLKADWHNIDGSTTTDYISLGGVTAIAAWTASGAWYTTVPAGAVTADLYAVVEGATAGTWRIDQIEVRKVIGTTLIQDAAITNAKIANLAVNDAKIANLSVGKLTAGTMTADVTIAGRYTTALTGARREMNSVGFQAFNASNVLTINLDGVNNLLTGIFRTALSGRRAEIGASGRIGSMDFFAPDGTNGFVQAYTESAGVEAIQLGIESGANSLWNRININTDEWTNYRSNKQDFYFGNATGLFIVRSTTDKGVTNQVTRLLIDSGGFSVSHSNGQNRLDINSTDFLVRDSTGDPRFWVNNTDTWIYNGSGQGRVQVGASDFFVFNTAGDVKFAVDGNGDFRFVSPAGGNSFLHIQPSPRLEATNSLGFVTRPFPGGGAFAGKLRYWINADFTAERLEVMNGNLSGYIPVWASAFTVNSDAGAKDNIRDLDVDGLAAVRGMRLRKWDEKDHTAEPGTQKVGKPRLGRIGLVAQEAPPAAVVDGGPDSGLGIDLYALITLALGAVKQLDTRLDALEAKPPKGTP